MCHMLMEMQQPPVSLHDRFVVYMDSDQLISHCVMKDCALTELLKSASWLIWLTWYFLRLNVNCESLHAVEHNSNLLG